jgi:hypothetical protein
VAAVSFAAVAIMTTMIGIPAAAAVIAASMAVIEVAMAAPAVLVAPAGPRTHAQEDAVEEVIRPVKARGCAAVRRIVVVAPLTDGWNADANDNLRASRWRQGQTREQCCRNE